MQDPSAARSRNSPSVPTSAKSGWLLRLCWLLLGGGIVGAFLFILVSIFLLDSRPDPKQRTELTTAKSNGETPLPKNDDPEPASTPHDPPAHADEVDRILGHSLKPPSPVPLPDNAAVNPPADPPVPLPASPKTKPDAPPPPVKKVTAAPGDNALLQRLNAGEDELRQQLLAVPELRLFSDLEIQAFRQTESTEARGQSSQSRKQLAYAFNVRLNQAMRQAAGKEGLPVMSGPKCQLDYAAAMVVQTLSKDLRDMGFVSVPGTPGLANFLRTRSRNAAAGGGLNQATANLDPSQQKMAAFQEWCDQNKVEKFRGALATLLQMLQVEDVPTRLLLVRELAKVKGAGATAALTKRALMDLSPEVRRAAVDALGKRSASQYVPVLLQGLRYPWAPVADRAAVALRSLKPDGVTSQLVDLLDQPDPSVPVLDPKTKKRTVRELVRLNHMRNCLLCHAPSADTQDGLVRGLVPIPGKPLPRLYYAGQSGDFVRADITFLRQDFSVNLESKEPGPWPKEQRFDFLTRTRTLKPDEMPDIAAKPTGYPQRDAVRYALRGLTGKDGGDSSEQWRRLLDIAAKSKTAAPSKDIAPRP